MGAYAGGACLPHSQGVYYALEEGETLDTPGVRLPSVKEFFTDLVEVNSIIHSGKRLAVQCPLRAFSLLLEVLMPRVLCVSM